MILTLYYVTTRDKGLFQRVIKAMTLEEETFGRYVSTHTIISYESAASLYKFCKALKLSKEEVVNDYGNPESLSALSIAKVIWQRHN